MSAYEYTLYKNSSVTITVNVAPNNELDMASSLIVTARKTRSEDFIVSRGFVGWRGLVRAVSELVIMLGELIAEGDEDKATKSAAKEMLYAIAQTSLFKIAISDGGCGDFRRGFYGETLREVLREAIIDIFGHERYTMMMATGQVFSIAIERFLVERKWNYQAYVLSHRKCDFVVLRSLVATSPREAMQSLYQLARDYPYSESNSYYIVARFIQLQEMGRYDIADNKEIIL